MNKHDLRREIKAALAALPAASAAAEDAAICRLILQKQIWQQADTVFCYVPAGNELDITPLLIAALETGKALCVPLITGDGIMEARRIASLDALRKGSFGIPEPPTDTPPVPPESIDLVILPGLAFDPRTHARLGKGGGYYDRFLPGCGGYKLAPCRLCQLRDDIPSEPHDVKVDEVLTVSI